MGERASPPLNDHQASLVGLLEGLLRDQFGQSSHEILACNHIAVRKPGSTRRISRNKPGV
jgi:hypothetical protein